MMNDTGGGYDDLFDEYDELCAGEIPFMDGRGEDEELDFDEPWPIPEPLAGISLYDEEGDESPQLRTLTSRE